MKLSDAIEAIEDASSPEYFKSVDAIENTDWEDVSFTFYEENEALKLAIKDALHECWDTPAAERILRDALLTAEEQEDE